jgi:hypothetical protein
MQELFLSEIFFSHPIDSINLYVYSTSKSWGWPETLNWRDEMDYDTYDMNAEAKAIREDMDYEAYKAQRAEAEFARIEWAQRNGNDSGFDPYAYL